MSKPDAAAQVKESKWRNRFKAILGAGGGGGLCILALLFGNWLYPLTIVLIAIFRREVRVVGDCGIVVVLTIICTDLSWPEKKQRIRVCIEISIELIQRNLVKEFLGREGI